MTNNCRNKWYYMVKNCNPRFRQGYLGGEHILGFLNHSLCYNNKPFEPVIKTEGGARKGDFMFVSLNFCISEAVIRCFQENRLTGWGVFPVNMRDRQNNVVNDYYGLYIRGRVGLDETQSRIIMHSSCPEYVKESEYRVGVKVDTSVWDGSDICTTKGINLLVTEKAANAMIQAGLTNAKLTLVEDMLFPVFHIEEENNGEQKAGCRNH